MPLIMAILNVKSIYSLLTHIKTNVCINSSKEKYIQLMEE